MSFRKQQDINFGSTLCFQNKLGWGLEAAFAPWTLAVAGSASPRSWWSIFLSADSVDCIAACRRASCWSSATTTTVTETSSSSTGTLRPSASSCCTFSTGRCASCRTCASCLSIMRCCTGAWRALTCSCAASDASTNACLIASYTSSRRRICGTTRSPRAAGWRG